MNWILAGLAFGFFGSVHCVGMCGPLALSLPGADQSRVRFVVERVVYNLGRVLTYTLLGGLVGLVGRGAALAGVQQAISVAIGTVMILAAAVPWVSRRVQQLERAPSALLGTVMKPIGGLYRRGGAGALLVVGLLNGLLPCGFVYAGLATALTAGEVVESMTFMAAFGLGTGPAMLGVSLVGRVASASARERLQQLVPYGLAFVGLLLIVRGLGLGSMLSPLLRPPAGLLLPLL
jgi:sulfite exporter TauE/SafE